MIYHAEKMHPAVTAIINGMFDTAVRLLALALASHSQIQRPLHLKENPEDAQHFNLNSADKDGMTYLHHLFVNFDQNPEKAGKLFRKMNQMHVRQSTSPKRNNKVMPSHEAATGG